MKNVLFTLAALLTTTSFVSAESGGDNDAVSQAVASSELEAMPAAKAKAHHHGGKHKKMSAADMKKACEAHLAKAKEAAGKITDAKYKTMADLIVGHMENVVKTYDSYKDEDGKFLTMLDKMCSWSFGQVEKLAKEEMKHQDAEKKKAERDAKKAEKAAKKADHKAEEKKDEHKADEHKAEEKKDEPKAEEKKDEHKADEHKAEEKK